MSESEALAIARLEERLKGVEEDIAAIRPRLHTISNAVNPIPLLFADIEKNKADLAKVNAALLAFKWLLMAVAPILAIISAVAPFLARR